MNPSRYAPAASLASAGTPVPEALRASLSAITLQSGLEGVDRLELRLANHGLRWLDHPLLALDRELSLSIGYAPDPLQQVFLGDVVGHSPTFPADGAPTLTVVAHDRREKLRGGTKTRWFAVVIPSVGTFPIPDLGVTAAVAAEGGLILAADPVSLAVSTAIGGISYAVAAASTGAQELVRKQRGQTDLDFVATIAGENGWALSVDHAGPLAGNVLRFTSLLSRVVPELGFRYGESLIEFTPRLTKVGEILAVTARTWVADAKLELTITAAWDWDKQALSVTVVPSMGLPSSSEKASASGEAPQADGTDSGPSWSLVDEAVDLSTAPRVILGKLLPKLNERLTGTATVVGEPRLRPGMVVTLDGVGQQFGGAYRVTSVTHTLDGGGFRTSFDVRKEVWFDGGHLLRGLKGALAAATPPGQLQQLTGVS